MIYLEDNAASPTAARNFLPLRRDGTKYKRCVALHQSKEPSWTLLSSIFVPLFYSIHLLLIPGHFCRNARQ